MKLNSIDRKTLNIALPLILSNITIPLVGFVDNLVMGHLGSSIYIGAIGIGSIIISYILFSFGFIKSITTGHISQTNGLGDYEKLFTSLSQIFVITFIISFLIILLRTNIIDLSMQLMDASASVKENSTIYLEYRIWSVPAIFLRDILIGYLIGIQLFEDQTKFIQKLLDNKLLTIRAAENVIRILPPLNVRKKEIDLALKIIKKVCLNYK